MRTIQGGVRLGNVVMSIMTKKRLKEIVRDTPHLVNFYPTSTMGPQFSGALSTMSNDITLVIVGPDPYTNRTWYANITRTEKGFKVT